MRSNHKDEGKKMNATAVGLVGTEGKKEGATSRRKVVEASASTVPGAGAALSETNPDAGDVFMEIRVGAQLRNREILSRYIAKKNAEYRTKKEKSNTK